MDTPKRMQKLLIEALDTDGKPVDTAFTVGFETSRLESSGDSPP